MLACVSRGVGTSFLPFRFGVKPEITFFRFSSNQANPLRSSNPINPTNPTNLSNSTNQNILFDFESEEELERLNWECHKWFELSNENVTSGKHSLKISLPPGQYPGINFNEIRSDWSGFGYLKMDIFNPSPELFDFHIRIDNNKSGSECADRFDIDLKLQQGLNQVSIPLDSIRTNLHRQPLNLKRIKGMIVFVPDNLRRRELYVDNIRLE